MIDVHCHLTSESFDEDRDAVLERARQAGVEAIVCVGESDEDNDAVLALARREPLLRAALGHHPDRLDEEGAERAIAQMLAHRDEIVAVGEVGLDHWVAKEEPERRRQHAIFRRLVATALALDLPLSVHSRSAGHHTIDILLELGAARVCLHAFDGKHRYAQAAAERGFYFSVPPSIVRSEQLRKLVRALPLDRLLIETDAPVLGPDRERRNEPANVVVSAQAIAQVKELPLEAILEACRANTLALFGPELLVGTHM